MTIDAKPSSTQAKPFSMHVHGPTYFPFLEEMLSNSSEMARQSESSAWCKYENGACPEKGIVVVVVCIEEGTGNVKILLDRLWHPTDVIIGIHIDLDNEVMKAEVERRVHWYYPKKPNIIFCYQSGHGPNCEITKRMLEAQRNEGEMYIEYATCITTRGEALLEKHLLRRYECLLLRPTSLHLRSTLRSQTSHALPLLSGTPWSSTYINDVNTENLWLGIKKENHNEVGIASLLPEDTPVERFVCGPIEETTKKPPIHEDEESPSRKVGHQNFQFSHGAASEYFDENYAGVHGA
ncbi:hypothetical protein BJ742DRAFT_740675 [Cladochytrium replicatum]|nr:hypothetical protein BJ742DRAFT_740675 [Cladochytrium replicatum]